MVGAEKDLDGERVVGAVRTWMFDQALPHWAKYGVDTRHGGAVESLAMDGASPSDAKFKRARVAARQLYVFSHAHVLGWAGARPVADHFWAGLRAQFWLDDHRGWARRADQFGKPDDTTADLYDFAFAVFALAWRYRAFGDPDAVDLAWRTLDVIEAHFHHADGGYHNALPPTSPRQQNPHMHLTEAVLALYAATSDRRCADLAARLTTLMTHRFLALGEGRLCEFFEDDWAPLAADKGNWIEPGHQFEWAWILAQHQALCAADHRSTIAALVSSAELFGVDPQSQATFNRVDFKGSPLDRGSRTWPNTERIKGWVARTGQCGAEAPQQALMAADLLLQRYLAPAPLGCWIDAFDAAGAPIVDAIPASTFYHVFLAFSELLDASV